VSDTWQHYPAQNTTFTSLSTSITMGKGKKKDKFAGKYYNPHLFAEQNATVPLHRQHPRLERDRVQMDIDRDIRNTCFGLSPKEAKKGAVLSIRVVYNTQDEYY
jgi:hypothetical protein